MTRRSHGLADRPGEPYPATFRIHFIEWSHGELNPDFRHAIAVSSRWTMTPLVERRGIEPRLPGCKPSVFPLDQRPVVLKRSVRELNPVFRLTTAVCCRNTYRPFASSDPGWNRTTGTHAQRGSLLHVTQASSPLDHGIMLSVTRVGVEPTKSPRPQRDRFTCLRTWSFRKWRVRGLRPAVPAYEARMSTGPPAISCRSRYRAERTGRMKASWTPVAPAMFK